jgi:fructose-bisphosphate aldolase class I
MNVADLTSTAQALVARGKGILAADESFPTIEKRFKKIGVSSSEDNRRAYRELLFTTKGAGEFVSGVILFDETLRQSAANGTPFTQVLKGQGIIPGIKVDKGAKALAGFPDEKITEGLDGLRAGYCVEANAHALARYAALCQEVGLVPIVEPEVLMDGDHTIERCESVTATTLSRVYTHLFEHRVVLEGTLLKPNMVLSGKECPRQAPVEEVADATVRCLLRSVPSAVPGIVKLRRPTSTP